MAPSTFPNVYPLGGVYAVLAGVCQDKQIPCIGEWILDNAGIPIPEYKVYASQFNPVKYASDAWVCLAKEAGMKYIVITTKHHDGFSLYGSKVTNWDVVDATPNGIQHPIDPTVPVILKGIYKLPESSSIRNILVFMVVI